MAVSTNHSIRKCLITLISTPKGGQLQSTAFHNIRKDNTLMEGMDYTARNKTQNGKKKGEMRRGERNQEVKFYKVIKT